jgi:hypothetical protein
MSSEAAARTDKFPIRAILIDHDGTRHFCRLPLTMKRQAEFASRVYWLSSLGDCSIGGWPIFREAG